MVTTGFQRGRGRGQEQGVDMNTYRFSVEKYYVVKAINYDEAVELLNDKNEYNYLVNEEWQLLSEEEGVSA
jgi:hypothetical protein